MDYVCDPTQAFGKRISDMTLDNGKQVEAGKKYSVTGWATVGSQSPGPAVWDVVADYLRLQKVAKINKINTPRLKNVGNNPGLMDYDA
jgi:sulfur-oxidizing protein SoxB